MSKKRMSRKGTIEPESNIEEPSRIQGFEGKLNLDFTPANSIDHDDGGIMMSTSEILDFSEGVDSQI